MPYDFDNSQAFTEGWGIFDCDGSANGQWQLCKLDDGTAFSEDIEAWGFVAGKALADNSVYHRAALDFLYTHNLEEYIRVVGRFLKH